ncbi:amino acid ABC transporter substrate-binding protein [Consotaella salsifontis]|uniref:Amino acid ABC transporter substrate-binding protein, PAAT family n=1 Tax=Consotaella salsifontis TaxID=1365950 RepID=A0A1T4PLC1_9HYPH|nr:amino acid ABC transporter substrate-binding protein [Consotaella salsifontis]SJZ91688.1 amino acid ABC transporter substrate-binding protein, PAAT family [Consotaella salsifontis]
MNKSLLAALSLTLLAAAPAFAGNLADIKQAGTLRIGTEGTYAPFTYHDASGKLVGFDVEIGEAVAKHLGVEPQFVEGKWDGLIAGLGSDRYDAVINQVGITPERQQRFDFSDPYIVSKAALIVKSDNDEIKSFDDLNGKRAAQSLTSNYGKMAQAAGATIVGTEGFDQSVQLVLTGRADATINDSLSFLDFKKHQPDAKVKVVETREDGAPSGIIVQKDNPELVAAINEALKDIKADGTYKAIAEKYFGEDVSR